MKQLADRYEVKNQPASCGSDSKVKLYRNVPGKNWPYRK